MSLLNSTFVIVALVFLTCSRPSSAITQVMLKEICSQTRDPQLCFNILLADPRTATADLYGIATTSINLAGTAATDIKNYILTLLQTPSNYMEQLTACEGTYNMMIDDLLHAGETFNQHDYIGMKINGQAVEANADKCEAIFQTAPVTTILSNSNRLMAILGELIDIMSSKFD